MFLQFNTTNLHKKSFSSVIKTLVLFISFLIDRAPRLQQKDKLDRNSVVFLTLESCGVWRAIEKHRYLLSCEVSYPELAVKPQSVPACFFMNVYYKHLWRITLKYVFFFPTALVIHEYLILSLNKIVMLKNIFVYSLSVLSVYTVLVDRNWQYELVWFHPWFN